jgi:hypothetical protein
MQQQQQQQAPPPQPPQPQAGGRQLSPHGRARENDGDDGGATSMVTVAVASRGATRQVRLPAAPTVAALRAALSRPRGASVRLVHMGRLLDDGDSRPLGEWYSDADVLRVVGGPAAPRGVPEPTGRVSAVAPPCGPEGGGTRVTAAGAGFGPHRAWALRFGSTVVPAHAVREGAQGERWSLCCLAPAHPPGVVSVDALCDGEPCEDAELSAGSFTYLSARQWAALVEQVAAPSHARNCMQALAHQGVGDGAGCTPRWST